MWAEDVDLLADLSCQRRPDGAPSTKAHFLEREPSDTHIDPVEVPHNPSQSIWPGGRQESEPYEHL